MTGNNIFLPLLTCIVDVNKLIQYFQFGTTKLRPRMAFPSSADVFACWFYKKARLDLWLTLSVVLFRWHSSATRYHVKESANDNNKTVLL